MRERWMSSNNGSVLNQALGKGGAGRFLVYLLMTREQLGRARVFYALDLQQWRGNCGDITTKIGARAAEIDVRADGGTKSKGVNEIAGGLRAKANCFLRSMSLCGMHNPCKHDQYNRCDQMGK